MDDPSFFEEDLDEEEAKRSILVTDIPENVSPKDVVIHFQKGSNGGGEVVNDDDHGTEHRSSVVITFEHPSIVEEVIKRQHIINGKEVTVHGYPIKTRIPEIFSRVDARINPDIFDVFGSFSSLKQVLDSLGREFGIGGYKNEYGYAIFGSYKQISLCRKSILDQIRNGKTTQKIPPESAHDDMAEAALLKVRGANSRSSGTSENEKIDAMVFQSVPIILRFIFTVSKYAKRIQDIESGFNVKIDGIEGDSKVTIRPLPRCTKRKHDDACEEYIKLYREVYDGPMMSKDILLRPGKGSFDSAKEAVQNVLEMKPIVIQKMDEQDKWMFYGEEADVRSAVLEVCKALRIDNPFRKVRKTKAQNVRGEEENDTVAADSHPMPSRTDAAEKDVLQENSNARSPFHKDFPGDKDQPFVIETKKGFRLTVYQGDITREQVDVIVNSTDKYLNFTVGLPAAIVKQGGRSIREEAETERRRRTVKPGEFVITGPGSLNCSTIMHILTNKYKDTKREGEQEHKRLVKEACFNCLKCFQAGKFKSIAFPAVGSGQQEMPLDVCAAAMVSAVEDYMKRNGPNKGAVTDIRFVHLDLAAVEAFKAELSRRYKDSILTPPGRAGIIKKTKHSTLTLPPEKGTGSRSDKKTGNKDEEDVCPICLDGFHDPVTLTKCNHTFCKKCIDLAFQHRKVCPTCGMVYGVQTGNMPPGTMNHYFDRYTRLPGYDKYGTIKIDYHFQNGRQGPEHPNPGQWYSGTARTAYLPDCPEGREVLDLLRKAFNARLTFTIGRSVTTGASNVVTWNDIHHKTNTHGGATGFGYPDPTYLKRVKDELAAKGIS